MHCEIATAADTSLLQFASNGKVEMKVGYAPLGPAFETPLFKAMETRVKSNPVLKKPLEFARTSSRELGAWCADQVWRFCFEEEEIKKLMAKTERRYHAKKITQPLSILEEQKAQIKVRRLRSRCSSRSEESIFDRIRIGDRPYPEHHECDSGDAKSQANTEIRRLATF